MTIRNSDGLKHIFFWIRYMVLVLDACITEAFTVKDSDSQV